jgi:hypothetical protein
MRDVHLNRHVATGRNTRHRYGCDIRVQRRQLGGKRRRAEEKKNQPSRKRLTTPICSSFISAGA